MTDILKSFARPADWIRHHADSRGAGCALASCSGAKTLWQRLRHPQAGTFLHGKFYCGPRCLETALVGQMSRLRAMSVPALPPNRIPLGLLMVARGKLTHLEVRAALEAQRRAHYGKIGEWFEKLGFATEQDVTSALALQWGCPVVSSLDPSTVEPYSNIPLPILEAFQMVPVNYVASSNTLYLAFGERVDHAALFAIEKCLDCRTQPCVAGCRRIALQLETMRQFSHPGDVVFATRDLNEMTRITSSYLNRVNPDEVRLSRIGHYLWLRLRVKEAVTNLLFCMHATLPQQGQSGGFNAATPLSALPAFP